MNEVESLAVRVRDLSQSVDFWNVVMLWGLALAALAAVVIGVSTRLVVVRSGQQSEAQELLSAAKDRQLAGDLKYRDEKIALAQKATEDERMARVLLEGEVARRRLTKEQQLSIASKLNRFPGQLAYPTFQQGDSEGYAFSSDITVALRAARWESFVPQQVRADIPGWQGGDSKSPIPSLYPGVLVEAHEDHGKTDTTKAAEALVGQLNRFGFDAVIQVWENTDVRAKPRIYVQVGPRPFGAQGEAKLRKAVNKNP
jgi:hypothetical protein